MILGSTGRFPRAGNVSSMPGQEGVKSVYSPMTRSLSSLSMVLKAVIDMEPWNYDPSCDPIPWRDVTLPKSVTFGVLADDGVIRPSPACARALDACIDALKKQGHSVVAFDAPSPSYALELASQLLLADGGKTCMAPFRAGEHNELGLAQMIRMFRLPGWLRRFISYVFKWRGEGLWSRLIEGWYERTGQEYQSLIAQRESYRLAFLDAWRSSNIDFLITVPNALPAVPHNALKDTFSSCGYTFLFNLVDYAAGVMPVTQVLPDTDALHTHFKARNYIEYNAYKHYNSQAMEGLPVGVQVVGRRLEEESVLQAMQLVEYALQESGVMNRT